MRCHKLLRGGYTQSNVSLASCLTVLLWQKLCDRLFGGSNNDQCFSQLVSQLHMLTEVLKLPDKFLEVCYTDQCFWQLDGLSTTPKRNFHDTNQLRKKLLRRSYSKCCGKKSWSLLVFKRLLLTFLVIVIYLVIKPLAIYPPCLYFRFSFLVNLHNRSFAWWRFFYYQA